MGPIADPREDDRSSIEWGWASQALGDPGEGHESGDLHVIAPFPHGWLVAVIDGLGHGFEAAAAAKTAAQILESDPSSSLVSLIQRCHEGLRRTRGAVMSLASFNQHQSSMTWIGVGNVEGLLLRADPAATRPREAIAMRGGVVGYQLPPLRPVTLDVSPGDTLIMATDGVQSSFTSSLSLVQSPQRLADLIMAGHRRGYDDALVVVGRYRGAHHE